MPQAPPFWTLAPYAGLAFDHDFQNGRYWQAVPILDPALLAACSRASTGYADDNSGTWSSFTSNVLRRTNRGLLIEEARTNGIRNNSMQGAVTGSPGTLPTNWAQNINAGITRTINAVSTSLGIEYIEVRLQGTISGGGTQTIWGIFFDGGTQIAATVGQVWSNSAFAAMTAGSVAGIDSIKVSWIENNSGGTFLTQQNSADIKGSLTSALQRFSLSTANTNASTAFVRPSITILGTSGNTVDITLRIGWPQMELGSWATSPIRTTTVAVTRAADADTVKALINASSIVVSGVTAAGIGSSNQVVWQWDDGTESNRIRIYRDTSKHMQCVATVSGSDQAALDLGVVNDSTAFKVGFAWGTNDFAATLNGGTMVTDSSGSVPSGLTTQRLGADSAGNQGNIYLRRQALWTSRVPNTQLQSATA